MQARMSHYKISYPWFWYRTRQIGLWQWCSISKCKFSVFLHHRPVVSLVKSDTVLFVISDGFLQSKKEFFIGGKFRNHFLAIISPPFPHSRARSHSVPKIYGGRSKYFLWAFSRARLVIYDGMGHSSYGAVGGRWPHVVFGRIISFLQTRDLFG